MPRHPIRAWARVLVGALLGVGVLALVISRIEWTALSAAVAGLAGGWLLLACAADLGAFALRAAKWRLLLCGATRIGYPAVLRATVIGALVTDVLPFRLDELVRAHLIGHRTRLSRSRILGTIAVERTLDVALLLGMIGALALASGALPDGLLRGGAVIGAALLLGLGLLLVARARDWGASLFGELLCGVRAAGRRMLPAAAICLLEWAMLFGMFWCVAIAFGLQGAAGHALALLVTSFLVFSFPISPGQVGVYEGAVQLMLVSRGLPEGQALAIALVAHLVVLGPTTILGAVFLAVEDLGLRELLQFAPQPRGETA